MAEAYVTYNVTGLYTRGDTVYAYHLVGTDGSQLTATKERIIYLISKGFVNNMRIQVSGSEMLIRGKGVNLNSLPTYDLDQESYRSSNGTNNSTDASKAPAGIGQIGQMYISKHIKYKDKHLGYVVADMAGNERKLSSKKVAELAAQGLLSNAIVQRYTPAGSTECQLILRGVGCDISNLPVITVDERGNIISEDASPVNSMVMRVTRMKRGGVVYDKLKNNTHVFECGDYLACGFNGVITIVRSDEAKQRFTKNKDATKADCDAYLSNLEYYPIEIFGGSTQTLNAEKVMSWPIMNVTRA